MKIIGPIAGIGSRLRPFTLSKPKAFINVAGKTVLEHILDKFCNTFGSDTELILIVGYKKKQITDFVKKKYQDKLDWISISMTQELTHKFIRKFKDKVDWQCISEYQKLSDDFIIEFQDKVSWPEIFMRKDISNKIINKFGHLMDMETIEYFIEEKKIKIEVIGIIGEKQKKLKVG